MFITLHFLRTMPLGLINRGADGLAKRGTFGGEIRQRVSPQCFKAHLRDHDAIREIAERIGQGMSRRSALIGEREIAPLLVAKGLDPDNALAYAKATLDLLFKGEEKAEKAGSAKPKDKKAKNDEEAEVEDDALEEVKKEKDKRQILCLGAPEIEAMAALAATAHRNGVEPKLLRGGKKLPSEVVDALKAIKAMKNHAGFDGALFGRMATSSVVSKVDGAVAVSNWLTTHPIHATTDYFSAQDQLQDEGESGAAHIGTRELASGVFYGNVMIDLARLMTNLGVTDHVVVRVVVEAIVEAVLSTDPSAQRGNTGAAAAIGEAVAEIGSAIGLSAMPAFESGTAVDMAAAREQLSRHLAERQRHLMPRQRPEVSVTLTKEPDAESFFARILDIVAPAPTSAKAA